MTRLEQARAVLGADVLGPEEITQALGKVPIVRKPPAVPFTKQQLEAAGEHGEMLVLRAPVGADGSPLTIAHLLAHNPDLFDKRLLRQLGYQLKTDWGIELEPLTAQETCAAGWALVTKNLLPGSINREYETQRDALGAHEARVAAAEGSVRRRSAAEAVYDLVLYQRARNVRLLGTSWDWTSSRTIDGGFLSVGGFGETGMQIFGYSPGVHHGGLGVCATRGRAR